MENLYSKNQRTYRTSRLGFRVTLQQEALIRRAAEITGKNLTQFIVSSACEAAENTLINQKIFFADDQKYQAFVKALERPVEIKPRLSKLMGSPAPWEE